MQPRNQIEQIAEMLTAFDVEPEPPYKEALELSPRLSGGSQPWTCTTADGLRYVVKCQNNRHNGFQPYKAITAELVCGRLGQLFAHAVCPPVGVINVSNEASCSTDVPDGWQIPCPGPSFGSQLIEGAYCVKSKPQLTQVKPEDAARIIVFRTWLNSGDASICVRNIDSRPFCVDHAAALTGPQWGEPIPGFPPDVKNPRTAPFQVNSLIQPGAFDVPLLELESLRRDDIVRCFAHVPKDWIDSPQTIPLFLARVADFVLRRRPQVRPAFESWLSRQLN